MKIAILETGAPPPPIATRHPTYGRMMIEMLAPLMPGVRFDIVRVHEGTPAPIEAQAVLITGSPAGVYDDHAWIASLLDAIRGYAESATPTVGICFGHQAMASALGGRVEKSASGWGVGVHRYEVAAEARWMAPREAVISCAVSHQDQVVAPPPGARVLAGSDFCPYGALSYAQGPAISFQMHPEFTHAFAADLLAHRADRIPADLVEAGLASLKHGSERNVIAGWIAGFFGLHTQGALS